MKHVYLFSERSRAEIYGGGTYFRQMIDCLKNEKDTSLNIVYLHADVKEFKEERKENCTSYFIPSITLNGDSHATQYYESVWFILRQYIQLREEDQLIVHLNFYHHHPLIKLAKEYYPQSKTFFTVHYQDWAFFVNGNTSHFKQIIRKEKEALKDDSEKSLYQSFKREQAVLLDIDVVICLSEYTKRLIISEFDVPEEKIVLIYNGLKDDAICLSPDEKRQIKKQLLISEEEKVIFFAGRLDGIKGGEVLIEAFKKVYDKYPECHLIMAGDGNYSVYLKAAKDYWNKITFTGLLEKEDLYRFYSIADVGVMPSFHEQCSYVAIEMMMFGIPLIISTTTGLNEMIEDGVNGFKLDVSDPEREDLSDCLADLIMKVLELTPEEYEAVRLRARANYDSKYSLPIMNENYKRLYDGKYNTLCNSRSSK